MKQARTHIHHRRVPTPIRRDALAIEMSGLERRYDGLIQPVRIEAMDRRLSAGGLGVVHSQRGVAFLRQTLQLSDGSVLRLQLLSPERRAFSSLQAISWQVGLGWDVHGTAVNGDSITCHAWRATLSLR
ncbi:MAG: hypothetical protein JWL72_456 [Ilumatobacteraceae bacterium]|nr:hypothetical protein [Ilumatobacteraceae bacterium]